MTTPDRFAACRPIATHIAYSGRFRTSNLRFTDEQFAHLHIIGEGSVRIMAGEESHCIAGPAIVFCRPGVRHGIMVPENASAAMLCSALLFDYGIANPWLKTLPALLHLPLTDDTAIACGMPFASLTADTPFSQATRKLVVEAIFSERIVPLLAASPPSSERRAVAPANTQDRTSPPPSLILPSSSDAELPRFTDFESSSREVLRYLRQRLDFDLVMITRTEGDHWTVLQREDRRYGVVPGTVFRWADTFCSHMVKGDGPRIAPNSNLIPAYASAPIGRQVHIKAYIGMPLLRNDGSLFGTLCAIHPSVKPPALAAEQAVLEMLAGRLNRILSLELDATASARRHEREQLAAHKDPATTAYTSEAWRTLLASEQARCRKYGHPAAVLAVRVEPGAKDASAADDRQAESRLAAAANALRKTGREGDIVARIGDREVAMLAAECNKIDAALLKERLRTALDKDGVDASVTLSMHASISETFEVHD